MTSTIEMYRIMWRMYLKQILQELSNLVNGVKTMFKDFYHWIVRKFPDICSFLQNFVDVLQDFMKQLWDKIVDFWDDIKDNPSESLDQLMNVMPLIVF
ncbi:MAG: hypothetical protein SNF68_05500 [Rikenellaceae bacterium]